MSAGEGSDHALSGASQSDCFPSQASDDALDVTRVGCGRGESSRLITLMRCQENVQVTVCTNPEGSDVCPNADPIMLVATWNAELALLVASPNNEAASAVISLNATT